jgi:hypothetical protein
MEDRKAFEKEKQIALNAAEAQGIADVVTAGSNGVSPGTVLLAAKLVEEHRKVAYERLEARLKSQA